MITESQATVGAKVWFYDNKAKVVNTEISSLVFKDNSQNLVVRCLGEKEAIRLDYLTLGHKSTEAVPIDVAEVVSAVSFELSIVDEKEPLRLTAALIKEKSKPLTDLTIANMFDEAGYDAVKKAKNRAVKTRTAIEKKEDEVLKQIKTRHKAEIKEVTDYTAELYAACKEVENDLLGKMEKVDNERAAAKAKADAELKAKTDGREKKMFELGLTWNGSHFVGYGKTITKEALFGLYNEPYEHLVAELEGLKMEHGVTGKESKTINPTYEVFGHNPINFSESKINSPSFTKAYPTAIFDETVDGVRFVITDGRITDTETGAKIVNKQILNSKYFVQAIGR